MPVGNPLPHGETAQGGPLKRELGERHIRLMALGACIGVGLFLGSAKAIEMAGPAIMLSYIIGGLIPLSPYMALDTPRTALLTSAGVTLLALWVFGYLKGSYGGTGAMNSALQTLLVGGLAAGAAFGVARLIT